MRHIRATIVAVEKQRILHNLGVYFLAFGTQHVMRMRHIVICGLSGYTTFTHITSQTA
jgi:hypothetical protein